MADLTNNDIADVAETPKRATVDGNTVEQHSLTEQIEAAHFAANKAAVNAPKRGFAIAKFRATGSQ